MRETKVFFLIAVFLIASCSKEADKTGESQKATAGAEGKQSENAEIEKEVKQLEGVWNQVATEKEGTRLETPPNADDMSILTFKGDEMTEKKKGDKDNKLSKSGKFRVDPTKPPKKLLFFAPGAKGPAKEVYELQGDELKVCSILGDNNFPSEVTGKKPRHVLVIYKRAKK